MMVRTATALVALFASGCSTIDRGDGVFRDCGPCPEMVVVPSGEFVMGSTSDEIANEKVPSFADREEPQHRVVIARPFAVARTETTIEEYAAFVSATERPTTSGCGTWNDEHNRWDIDSNATWQSAGIPQTSDHPVVCVSWHDAKAYAAWLSQETGKTYRLLSESEWEYAARAGTSLARPWATAMSNGRDTACKFANGADRDHAETTGASTDPEKTLACRDGYAFTAPVRSFLPNGYGLTDMLGNVWEWIEDCRVDNYRGAPADGSAWITPDCPRRDVRGGSWGNLPRFLRSAARAHNPAETRNVYVGFRVARDVD